MEPLVPVDPLEPVEPFDEAPLVLAPEPVEDDPFDPAPPVEAELLPVADDLPLDDPLELDFPEVLPLDPLDRPVVPVEAAAALDWVAPEEDVLEIDEVEDPALPDEVTLEIEPDEVPALTLLDPVEAMALAVDDEELPGAPVEAVALAELPAVLEV